MAENPAYILKLLDEGKRIIELRNTYLVPKLRNQDLQGAEDIARALLSHAPDDSLVLRDMANICVRSKKFDIAEQSITKALQATDDPDHAMIAQAIQVYLAAGCISDAARLALENRDNWSAHLKVANMSLLALHRWQDASTHDIVTAAENVAASSDASLDMKAKAGAILLNNGEARKCLSYLQSSEVTHSKHAGCLFILAKAQHLCDHQLASIDLLLDRCLSCDPQHLQAIDLRSRRHLESGKAQAAIKCISAVPSDIWTKGIKRTCALAMCDIGEVDQAIRLFNELLLENPSNSQMRKTFAGALAQHGSIDEARAMYFDGIKIRDASLAPTLKQSIENLLASCPKTEIPKYRANWLLDELKSIDKAPEEEDKWLEYQHKFLALDRLLVDWVECRTSEFDEFRPLFSISSKTKEILDDAISSDTGLIVAAAHVGILFSGPILLRAFEYPFAWLASLPDLQRGEIDANLISTTSNDDRKMIRQLMTAVRAKKIITVAIDGAAETQQPKYTLMGQKIGLSEFVPMVAYRSKIPTAFPSLTWLDGQIHAKLVRLPDPKPRETADAFVARWMESFLQHLADFIVDHSDQARLSGGFWSTLMR